MDVRSGAGRSEVNASSNIARFRAIGALHGKYLAAPELAYVIPVIKRPTLVRVKKLSYPTLRVLSACTRARSCEHERNPQ